MAISGNLVFQFTTGTGTGSLTLSAMTGDTPSQYFRDFSTVFGTGTGNKFYYCVRHRTAAEFEVGIGYMSSSTVMVRDSIIESSNANAAVNFSAGTKDVISDIPSSVQNFLSVVDTLGQGYTYLPQSGISGTPTAPGYISKTSRGTAASPTRVAAGDILGKFEIEAYTGIASPGYKQMSAIYAKASGSTANELGSDIIFANKRNNNIGFYDVLKIDQNGQFISPLGTGNYNYQGIMVTTPAGPILSGQLNLFDAGYFAGDNSYGLIFADPNSGGINRSDFLYNSADMNGYFLTIGGSGFDKPYNGPLIYAQPGYAALNIQTNNNSAAYIVGDNAYTYIWDTHASRKGTMVLGQDDATSTDATLIVYEGGNGDPIVKLCDKSDNEIVTWNNSLLDMEKSDISCAVIRLNGGTLSAEGYLAYDSTQFALGIFASGVKQVVSTCLFTQTADKTVANTVTETSLFGTGVGTVTLPANFFVAGKTIRLRVGGIYSTPALATPSLIIKVKYGSTVLATVTTTALLSGATNLEFDGEVLITCRTTGSSGTVMCHGDVEYATGVAGTISVDPLNNAGATTTINTSPSNAIDVTVQWDTATSTRIAKSTITTIEVLN